jgi:hypothetical protein
MLICSACGLEVLEGPATCPVGGINRHTPGAKPSRNDAFAE